MAPILAHEYGHHYTIVNISKYEQKVFTEWQNTEYAKIRGFDSYPVIYCTDYTMNIHNYAWDVAEIAANDYVQLLGSANSRASYPYMDSKQILDSKSSGSYRFPIKYNARPQVNLVLPLASDVEGLYEYFLKIGNKQGDSAPELIKRASVLSLTETVNIVNKTYELEFEKAEGAGNLEYTVVMIPESDPFSLVILKTLKDEDELYVTFGTFTTLDGDRYIGVLESYNGKHEIRIHT